MARLEIEIGVKGASSVGKSLSDIENNLSKLNVSYAKTVQEIAKVTQVTNELEGELRNLSSQLKTGAISQSQFDKESVEVSQALGSARQAAQQYQSRLSSLQATIKQNASAQNDFGDATKKLKPVHRDFQHGVASANGVALEFGRIVQDIPYGMQGIANNLQQLTTNFGYYATRAKEAAAANGQVLTSGALMKGVFSSLISPANLLTLGISLLTAGYVAYEKWVQSSGKAAEKAAKEAKAANKEYIDTLNDIDAARLKGTQSAQAEISQLNVLYTVTQDTSQSIDTRRRAVDELQKTYPAYFKNIKDEVILAGEAKNAYLELTTALLATAEARAAEGRISKNAEKILENQLKIEKNQLEANKSQLNVDYQREQLAKSNQVLEGSTIARLRIQESSEKEILRLNEENNNLAKENGELTGENNKLIDRAVSLYKDKVKEGEKDTKELTKQVELLDTFDSKLQSILGKSNNSAAQSGLTGVDLDIEKTRQEYASMFNSINELEINSLKNTKLTEQERNKIISGSFLARQQLTENYIKEQEDNEQKRVGITEEAEAKIANISLDYTRRLKEKQSQIMIRSLNDEFKAREKLANDTLTTESERLAAQAKLQEEYWQRLELVQKFAEIENLSLALGDAVGNAFENMLTSGTDIFTSLVAEFKKAILKMIAQGAALSASKVFGKLLGIGTTVATGGGAGFFGKIVKGLLGFQSGGYTGNIPKNQVAGVVHGQEMVMDAKATRKYGSLLNSMQNGSFNPNSMGTISPVISGDKDIYIAETVIRGTDLVTVYKRAEKSIGRYGS